MPLLSARVGRPFDRAVENPPAIDMIALFEVVDWSEDRGEVALRGMNSDPRALFIKLNGGGDAGEPAAAGHAPAGFNNSGCVSHIPRKSSQYNHRMSFSPAREG